MCALIGGRGLCELEIEHRQTLSSFVNNDRLTRHAKMENFVTINREFSLSRLIPPRCYFLHLLIQTPPYRPLATYAHDQQCGARFAVRYETVVNVQHVIGGA